MLRRTRVPLAASALALVLPFLAAVPAAAAPAPAGPDITVVGFGIAVGRPVPTGQASPYQLNLDFQVRSPDLSRALSDLEAMVRHASVRFAAIGVPASSIVTQGVNINMNQGKDIALQVNEQVVVNLSGPGQVDKAVAILTTPSGRIGLQNFYLNSGIGGGVLAISTAALERAYAQAWADARQTALAMARAQGLALGAVVAESQGQENGGCVGAMGGGCPVVSYPGPVGPNQQVESMTVTFATKAAVHG